MLDTKPRRRTQDPGPTHHPPATGARPLTSSIPGDRAGTPPIAHRTHRLADGREAVFFSDRGAAPVERVADTRPLGENLKSPG